MTVAGTATASRPARRFSSELPREPSTGCCTKRGDALITAIGSTPVADTADTVTGTGFPRTPSSSFRTTTAATATTVPGITTTDTMAITVPGTGITTTVLAMATTVRDAGTMELATATRVPVTATTFPAAAHITGQCIAVDGGWTAAGVGVAAAQRHT